MNPTKPTRYEPLWKDRTLLVLLLFGLLLRLYNMADPLFDTDSFRQTATASIAKNYYLNGMHLFQPQITGWGTLNKPGLWPNEFPLYPYAIACLYQIFGVHEWFGRFITALFCLIGAGALYDIVRRMDNPIVARFAVFWYLIGPQAIYHGRCFHRHPVAIALMLVTGAAMLRWLQNPQYRSYIVMTVCGAMALLMMPPLAIYFIPALLMYYAIQKRSAFGDRRMWFSAVLMFLPSLLWYYWAIQQNASYSLRPHGRDDFRNWGSLQYYTLWWKHDLFRKSWWTLWQFTLGPIGTTLAAAGLVYRMGRAPFLPLIWTAIVFTYYVFDVYPIAIVPHYIYFLLLLAPLSWSAGRICCAIWERLETPSLIPHISLRCALVFAMAFGTLFHWDKTFRPWYLVKSNWVQAANMIRHNTPKDARIVIDEFDPSIMYYSDRMGVCKSPDDIDLDAILQHVKEGATYLAIVNQSQFYKHIALRVYLKETAENILITNYLRLYRLNVKPSPETDWEAVKEKYEEKDENIWIR